MTRAYIDDNVKERLKAADAVFGSVASDSEQECS